ncbi:hypothetical protein NL676_026882 [Syzygium grande]|nr:hypothetical protein NL676_026882 [Syzygium grande]
METTAAKRSEEKKKKLSEKSKSRIPRTLLAPASSRFVLLFDGETWAGDRKSELERARRDLRLRLLPSTVARSRSDTAIVYFLRPNARGFLDEASARGFGLKLILFWSGKRGLSRRIFGSGSANTSPTLQQFDRATSCNIEEDK